MRFQASITNSSVIFHKLPLFLLLNDTRDLYTNKWCAQKLIKLMNELQTLKIQIVDRFIYIMNWSVKPHFNSVFDLQIKYSETFFKFCN